MEHKGERTKEAPTSATESKGVLGSVWSAAGAIAETVQHAVQGTIDAAYHTADRIQHDAEAVSTVGEYVAHKVVDSASSVYDKTLQTAGNVVPALKSKTEPKQPTVDSWLSSPTSDYIAASKSSSPSTTISDTIADTTAKTGELYEAAKKSVSDTISSVSAKVSEVVPDVAKVSLNEVSATAADIFESAKHTASASIESAKQMATEIAGPKPSEPFKLELTMDVVAHLQRIADRTGDKLLHETARKAHSACAKGVSDAPGVHLVRVTPEQATELVNLAIMTQDHELADFARYCQSVAATTQIGIEPTPGKIQEELAKGRQELSQQGRVHTGPGYGAAFASVGRVAPSTAQPAPALIPPSVQPIQPVLAAPANAQLTMDMVAHIQRIADRTGDNVLHDTARRAHSACAKGINEAPGVHLVSISPDQASELVNLAIRTQDHELANFARYCQSVAATTQIGIEPTPGKIMEEINKGRQELSQQGRAHTGPGYGAAFASISRSNSSQSLGRTSRSTSPTNIPITAPAQPQEQQVQPQEQQTPSQPSLQLTMDVVAHLQRIADRTGDTLLHETARRAHSACARNVHEAPGVHLTWVTSDQATELVNLAIRTQDHELADFARYCQSVAATSQIAVEPSPGKIREEIEKGRQELAQLGRAHTGPGYGAAFASAKPQQQQQQQIRVEPQQEIKTVPLQEIKIEPSQDCQLITAPLAKIEPQALPQQATSVGQPSQ